MAQRQTKAIDGTQGPEPNIADLLSKGWQLRSAERRDQAAELCHTVLANNPTQGEAWHLLGLLSWDQGDATTAIRHFKQAIQVEPDQAHHYNNIGVVLNETQRHAKSKFYLQHALWIDPNYLDAKCNLGLAFYHLNDLSQAAALFQQVLNAKPEHAAALANLGLIHLTQQNYSQAISFYQRVIAIDAGVSQWHGNLGAAHAGMGDFDHAAACYQEALDLEPDNLDFSISLAVALRNIGKLHLSINILNNAYSIDPNRSDVLINLIIAFEQTCHWDRLGKLYDQLDRATKTALTGGELPSEDPMLNLRRSDDLALNRALAQTWSQHIKFNALQLASPFDHHTARSKDERITIGYLSYDFRNHPVAHQIFPLFQLHDRSRFKIIAFSMGPDDKSAYRAAVKAHCDAFIDISTCGLVEAAQLIYRQKTDILIDLMGHSRHNRMGILALRPAPVQVGYLGFLSTSGADFIDYLVTDDVVLPAEHHDFYTEQLLRLPDCYQINHTLRLEDAPRSRRAEWHLPDPGFVFCCFNAAYKIDQALFDAWMRILDATPDAVLWLFESNPLAMDHMRHRAGQQGIDPQRLVFATKLPLDQHLARLPLADLALDTLRYNGGATTANALCSGLPVLTVLGKHWVSRMSASHLIAAGLPDLISHDLASYEHKAIALARNPNRLQDVRRRLFRNLKKRPLFDPRCFVRALEVEYGAIWNRYLSGQGTNSTSIPVQPGDHRTEFQSAAGLVRHPKADSE